MGRAAVRADVLEFETLLYREENGVAYLTLNRPEVQNSFDDTMMDELARVWQALRSNDAVRAVVLTGAGDKAFCTGNDRNAIPFDVKWDPYTYDDPGLAIGPRVNRMWKPVIAAVNGTAAAGAFYLLGQVDFIIAAEHATFVDPHVTYSMPAVYEPIELLARMPFGEAMRMALLGANERMSARRAHEIGFVSEVVPLDELMIASTWAAETIAQQPSTAIMATMRNLWAARDMLPAQATALGNMFLHLGVDREKTVLKEGEEAFVNRPRAKPRVR
jgi:enoyl-CoA hydratase/carnithine racemase